MASPNWPIVLEACRLLGLNNRGLAEYLGYSRRTIQRRLRTGGFTFAPDLHQLAIGVHPHNPALATKLAKAGGTTPEALGLIAPAAAQAVAAKPEVTARPEHADSVVCAAADALKLHPAAVRPAIAAALSRMQALGLTVETLRLLLRSEKAAKP